MGKTQSLIGNDLCPPLPEGKQGQDCKFTDFSALAIGLGTSGYVSSKRITEK